MKKMTLPPHKKLNLEARTGCSSKGRYAGSLTDGSMREECTPGTPKGTYWSPTQKRKKCFFLSFFGRQLPEEVNCGENGEQSRSGIPKKNNKHSGSKETISFRENVQRYYSCFGIVRKKPFQEKKHRRRNRIVLIYCFDIRTPVLHTPLTEN